MTPELVLWSALVAGLASNLGPCATQRYILLAAQIAGGVSAIRLGSFLAGCAGGYLVFASAGAVTVLADVNSHVLYGCTSAVLLTSGLWTLFVKRDREKPHIEACPHSIGAHFLGGIGCSAIAAPCCVPVAIAFGIQSAQHDAVFAATMMAAFGIGQIAPMTAVAFLSKARCFARHAFAANLSTTISGALLTAVGALYGAAA